VVTFLIGLTACGLALVAGGTPELVGALVGTAVVAGFFLFGMLNAALAAAFAPRASLVVAMLTYTMQVVALGLLLTALTRSDSTADVLDVGWLGGTVIAGALGWTLALVIHALRAPLDTTPIPAATPASTPTSNSTDVTSSGVVRR
jgi:ATP synthase protein I